MKPQRIQRKRTKGWKMPPNTVYVGRPTTWGNPFHIGPTTTVNGEVEYWDAEKCVALFRFSMCATDRPGIYTDFELNEIDLNPLRGKDLACWCPLVDEHGQRFPCHADVLLELANAQAPGSYRGGRAHPTADRRQRWTRNVNAAAAWATSAECVSSRTVTAPARTGRT